MQREILFRAQRKSGKYWLDGDLIKKGSRRFIGYEIEKSVEDYGVENSAGAPGWKTEYVYIEAEVIPETVGQYIGINDKNDTKIFEDDILEDVFESGITQIVVYDLDRFIVKGSGVRISSYATPNKINVIGNIFQNPELLTKDTVK